MGLLDKIRVLDFSHVYFGPYATMILGDMGADVIKVEPTGGRWPASTRPSSAR